MAQGPAFLVDEIFPSREFHLICGPSGAGKSTWSYQFLCDLSRGLPIFGRTSHAVACGYLALDRSTDSIERTLDRLGIRDQMCPFIGAEKVQPQPQISTILDAARSMKANVIFVEAILRTIRGKSNDYNTIGDLMVGLMALCKQCDLTIFGSTHVPKHRENGGLVDARQKPLGSVAFAGLAETIILIERIDTADLSDRRRRFTIMPRNVPEETIEMSLDKTGFKPLVAEPSDAILDSALHSFRHDVFERKNALEWGREAGLSDRTVERWIQKRLGSYIQKLSKGKYARLKVQ